MRRLTQTMEKRRVRQQSKVNIYISPPGGRDKKVTKPYQKKKSTGRFNLPNVRRESTLRKVGCLK